MKQIKRNEEKLRMFPSISAVAISSMNTMIEGWRRGEQEAADGNDIAYSEIVIRVLERKTKIDYKKDVKRWFPQFRGYCGKRIDGIRLKWWWNKDNVFSKRKIKRLVKKRSLNIYTRPIDERFLMDFLYLMYQHLEYQQPPPQWRQAIEALELYKQREIKQSEYLDEECGDEHYDSTSCDDE